MARRFQNRPHGGSDSLRSSGFTLIELLVAMTILVILVMIVGQLFQQATVAWNSGTQRAEVNMQGRALADYMAQELSQAVSNEVYDVFNVEDGGRSAEFHILADATPPDKRCDRRIKYELAGKTLRRVVDGGPVVDEMGDGIDSLLFFVSPFSDGLPLFVDVRVTMTNGVYESRACLLNRDRYRLGR